MNCPVCGKSVPAGDDINFCPHCGSPLDAAQAATGGAGAVRRLPKVRLEKEHIVVTPPGGSPIRIPREPVENAARGAAVAALAYLTKRRASGSSGGSSGGHSSSASDEAEGGESRSRWSLRKRDNA